MSAEPCSADANDLALDPALRQLKTPGRHADQYFLIAFLLAVCPAICLTALALFFLISHFFSLEPISLHLCRLKFLISPPTLRPPSLPSLSVSLTPKHTLQYLLPLQPPVPLHRPLSSLNYSLRRSQSRSLYFIQPTSPSFSSFSLSLSIPSFPISPPGQQLHCPWVGGGTMSAHMGPQCSPSREGRQHRRTPITQCFNGAAG